MSGYEVVKGPVVVPTAGATYFAQLNCPAGKKAIRPGFIGAPDGMATIFSYPSDGGAVWYLRVKNLGGASNFGAYVICANVS